MKSSMFVKGLKAGIPIALGYLSVSIGVGITAVGTQVINIFQAVLMSLTNLTSAGQVAGIGVIGEAAGILSGAALVEMALTQLVINLRYSLMGISLTQKLVPGYKTGHRLLTSFGITDEVFAVASTRDFEICPSFMYGLILLPILGWSAGTFIGAFAGQVLPEEIRNAMEILIYGMFIAIVVPDAKKKLSVFVCSALAIGAACLFKYVLTSVSGGIAIIVSAVVASAVAALLFPVKDDAENEDTPADESVSTEVTE